MTVGRNDPCPCGSGKKFKQCCGRTQRSNRTAAIAVGALTLIGAALVVAALNRDEPSARSRTLQLAVPQGAATPAPAPAATSTAPASQVASTIPAGATPPNKVWSKEHGHWHDAKTTTPTAPAAGTPVRVDVSGAGSAVQIETSTQPMTAADSGMVWSAEHGHYHPVGNAPEGPGANRIFNVRPFPAGRPAARPLVPQPAGPVPEGKVWSPEHGHWHNAKSDGTTTDH